MSDFFNNYKNYMRIIKTSIEQNSTQRRVAIYKGCASIFYFQTW